VNFKVRLFSVTVLTTWSEAPPGISASTSRVIGDVGVDDAGEVGDDLLGDASGVAAEAGGVEGDGAMKPLGLGGLGFGVTEGVVPASSGR
jgi:hypothetical protein